MKNLLEEIEHTLVSLNGLYVTDKKSSLLDRGIEDEEIWMIETPILLQKIEKVIENKDIYNQIEVILQQMKKMNEFIKTNPEIPEVDKIYFDNKFAIFKMEYDYLMLLID